LIDEVSFYFMREVYSSTFYIYPYINLYLSFLVWKLNKIYKNGKEIDKTIRITITMIVNMKPTPIGGWLVFSGSENTRTVSSKSI